MSNKLYAYIPPFMTGYAEMREILDAQYGILSSVWDSMDATLHNQFIDEVDENGIERFESMLKLSPKDGETLEERKFRVLSTMNQDTPYTVKKLASVLNTVVGEGNFTITVDNDNYTILVKLALVSQGSYDDCVKLVQRMIPANLIYSVQILFNRNSVLTQFTHGGMQPYTHDQLRKEVFD